MVLYASFLNKIKNILVSVRAQVARLSLDIQHTQQNKSNRHLEQRRNRKSALGNLYIGGVHAEFLRRDAPAVETIRAAAIKGQRLRNPTGLKTASSSTPLLPMPQPGWRVVHKSPQIQRSLPPVPPPSSAVGAVRPPGPFGWVFGFSFDHPDIFLCRPGLCVLRLR